MKGGLQQEERSCSNEENYLHSKKTDMQELSHSMKRERVISTGQPSQPTQVCQTLCDATKRTSEEVPNPLCPSVRPLTKKIDER